MTRKHLILMAVGCLLPLTALATVFIFQVQVSTMVWLGLLLLCPAAHLLMMRSHMGHEIQRDIHETSDTKS